MADRRPAQERPFGFALMAVIAKLKEFRRVATRYDKLLQDFPGFVKRAAIAIRLERLNRHHVRGHCAAVFRRTCSD